MVPAWFLYRPEKHTKGKHTQIMKARQQDLDSRDFMLNTSSISECPVAVCKH